jgi:hypothetical protein
MSHTLLPVHKSLSFAATALAVVILVASAAALPSGTASAASSRDSAAGHAAPETAQKKSKRIKKAEKLVLAELSDAPVWDGLTVEGIKVSRRVICVDRTWAPGSGPDAKGGNAGYVVVKFPKKKSGHVKLADPRDGVCAGYSPATAKPVAKVDVPEKLEKKKGLLVSTKFGDDWPLTVPYAVVHCKDITVGGNQLNVVTLDAPDGTRYAVNGTAQDQTTYPGIDPIWAPDPSVDGLKINISPVIDAGLDLCR